MHHHHRHHHHHHSSSKQELFLPSSETSPAAAHEITSFYLDLLPARRRGDSMGASDAKALALVAFLAIVHGTRSLGGGCPSAAPAPTSPTCTERLLNLTACLTYVEQGSNLTRPRKGCCPSLASLVDDDPICLCRLIGNYDDDVGVRVDATRVLMLPAACHVDAPPTSLCAVLGTPMSSPSPSSGGPKMPEAPRAGSSPPSALGTPMATPPNGSSGDTALGTFNRVFLLLCPLLLLFASLSH